MASPSSLYFLFAWPQTSARLIANEPTKWKSFATVFPSAAESMHVKLGANKNRHESLFFLYKYKPTKKNNNNRKKSKTRTHVVRKNTDEIKRDKKKGTKQLVGSFFFYLFFSWFWLVLRSLKVASVRHLSLRSCRTFRFVFRLFDFFFFFTSISHDVTRNWQLLTYEHLILVRYDQTELGSSQSVKLLIVIEMVDSGAC